MSEGICRSLTHTAPSAIDGGQRGDSAWARGCHGVIVVLAAALAMALLLTGQAQAQITTEQLIGDSVSDIGSRYPDVDEAVKRFNNRDVIGAGQFLEAAKAKDPKLPPTGLLMARMYLMSGNVAAGRASLERTVAANPGDPEPYVVVADQSIAAGRTIESEALYDKAISLVDAFDQNAKRKRTLAIRCRSGRALVAERRKNWQGAATDLQALIGLDPDDAMAHYRLGRVLFMLGKARDGYNEFVKADQLDAKKMPQPYVAAAMAYDQLDQQNEAQQAFERAMTADKSDPETITAYARWLTKAGSVDKAESLLATARQANPENLDILILSGVTARMNKKMKPAEDFFIEALGKAPSNGSVINQLALLLVDQPDEVKRNRALEFAAMNAKVNPESADAQITLAWVLYQLGRNQEAGNALRAGLQLGNPMPDSSYLVAKMLIDQNQISGARQLLSAALEADVSGIFVNRKEAQELLKSLEGK
jgi:tetratricopeptide (TPR) repeat protein